MGSAKSREAAREIFDRELVQIQNINDFAGAGGECWRSDDAIGDVKSGFFSVPYGLQSTYINNKKHLELMYDQSETRKSFKSCTEFRGR